MLSVIEGQANENKDEKQQQQQNKEQNKEQNENQNGKQKRKKREREKIVPTVGFEPGTEGLQILGVTTGLTGHLLAARFLDRFLTFSHVHPVEIDRKRHSMFFMKCLLSNNLTRQYV